MDKVYVIREYGGSYDDAWEHIIGVYTDKTKAKEFRDSYWKSIELARDAVRKVLNSRNQQICMYNEDDEDEEDWKAVNESYRLDDIACVKVTEYPLNKVVCMYYGGNNG